MAARSYNQVCGVAKALDLLGDRWTMLMVRELLLGPKRFSALTDAMPGIGPNLLSKRLRELSEAGVIAQVELAPPASVTAYALTDLGEELREPVESLALWGFRLLDGPAEYRKGSLGRGSWLASTLAAASARSEDWAEIPKLTINFDVDGDRFVLRTDGSRAHVRHGFDEAAASSISCDFPSFAGLALGSEASADPVAGPVLSTLAAGAPARAPSRSSAASA
ncbi:winged helix-turn-helix transcriptional regulator [soil metagenome]